MSLKFTQLMGKSKDPIIKFKGIDVKKYSKDYEELLKKKSDKKREEEKMRKKNILHPERKNRVFSTDSHKSQSPKDNQKTNSQYNQSGKFPFNICEEEEKNIERLNNQRPQPTKAQIKEVKKEEKTETSASEEKAFDDLMHKARHKKEYLELLSLIPQFFDVKFRPFHVIYPTPYGKKTYQKTCFGPFSEDRSNIDYLEKDYQNCYISPLLNDKNLGRYDCWEDKTPEEWLKICRENDDQYDGTSPMYDYSNDKFMWNYAKVMDYDPEKLKYKIKFTITEKEVPRLSFKFRWENQNEFNYRKYLCERRRARVDQFNLFTRYVDNVPNDMVAPLNFDWLKRIENKVKFTSKNLNLNETYNKLFDESNPNFYRETMVVKQDYLRQMKKCRILLEMQEEENFQDFKNRSLDIRPFYRYIPTTKHGIVNRSLDFQKCFNAINKDSFFRDKVLVEDLMVPFLKMNEDMKKDIKLILCNLDVNSLPLEIKEFQNQNTKFTKKSSSALRNICNAGFNGLIRGLENKNRKYSCLIASKDDYDRTDIKKIVIYLNMILKTKAKDLVDNSIISFMKFFRQFGECKYEANDKTDLVKELGTHYLESSRPLFHTKIILKKIEVEKKKKQNVKEKRCEIVFSPSLDEFKESLLGALTGIKTIISEEIKNLSFLCFKLIDIEDTKIYTLEDDYPLYAQAQKELTEIIDTAIEQAEVKRKEFEEFNEILEETEEMYVKNKLGTVKETNKNLDVNLCKEILEKLNYYQNLHNTKETNIDQRLFNISTEKIKETITKHIDKIREIMIERMSLYCIDRTGELEQENNEKIAKIKSEITDIDQYKELYDLLQEIPKFVDVKKKELKNVGAILVIIEEQRSGPINKAMDLFGKLIATSMIPSTISDESKKKSDSLELLKFDFGEQLKKKQKQFKEDIAVMEKEFDTITKINSFKMERLDPNNANIPKDENKIFKLIEDFDDKVRDQKAAQAQIIKEMKILNPEKIKDIEDKKEDLPEFEKLEKNEKEFEPYKILWGEYKLTIREYKSKLNNTLKDFKDADELAFQGKKSTKDEFLYVNDLADCREKVEDVEEQQKSNPYDNSTLMNLIDEMKKELEEFESYSWIIQNLNASCLKDNDWDEIRKVMGDQSIKPSCRLKELKEKNIDDFRDQIELIKSKASRRLNFVIKFKEIADKYNTLALTWKDSRENGFTKLDDALIDLDALSSDLINIISNPVTQSDKKLKEETRSLNEKIKNAQIILEEVVKFQSNYFYLEPIFNTKGINDELKNDKANFLIVDKFWMGPNGLMESFKNSSVTPSILLEKENFQTLYNNLVNYNLKLQDIIRKLNDYLNKKRAKFPRFYFVSDEDLLRILAQSQNPLLIQPHLSKCFEGINHVIFNSTNSVIQKLVSSRGEVIQLVKMIDINDEKCRGNVENWLTLLEESMINTMKDLAAKTLKDLDKKPRIDWIKDMEWPGQLIQVIDQVMWTSGVEEGILSKDLKGYLGKLDHELSLVVDLVRGKIHNLLSRTLSGLIVISVHNRDIVENLMKINTEKIDDFEWKAEMRYYFREEETKKKHKAFCPIIVQMITTTLDYGFEYLGNYSRLVITPLTDRCFRTLFSAYNVKYGGAPEGPAGTGKTESVKDLAKCVGVMCNVFNCTEGIKTKGMEKFFKGLASSGCWCCFDEFNRIDTEVLSVIAQQILTIQNALKASAELFSFDDVEQVPIKSTCAINITMNPSYSGRNELPDNLKALFRPCAMMVADYNLIAQILLYSYGFQTAKSLSFKIVSSLKLSSEQLSTQSHYDFGMRALNAILVAAGKQKKNNPKLEEDRICLRALLDVNLPKFTCNDIPLFIQLVKDLFPSTEPIESDLSLLSNEIEKVATSEKNNLQPTANFVKKCIQLYETMNVRHALMIVGKAGMGKTKVITTLKEAMSNLPLDKGFNKVETTTLNPKSIFQKKLYGYFDSSQEWKKGLLQVKMTELVEKPKEFFKWLIFDGPVDTLWIENMNSLLDDNKKLCLEDSSSIFLADNMNIVFEVDDLKEASPATISRNGMVLCETDTISTDDLILSYVNTLPTNHFNHKLIEQFKVNSIWLTNTIIEYIFKDNVEFGLPCDKFHLVINFLNVFECYIKDYKNSDIIISKEREITADKLDNLLINSVIIGLLGPVKKDRKLQTFLYDVSLGNNVNEQYKLNFNSEFSINPYQWEPKRLNTNIHQIENIFETVYILETGKWHKWVEIPGTKDFVPTKEMKFNELVIPTPDTIKMGWLISMVVPIKRHLLFTGPTGTGKTLTILNNLMSNYENDMFTYIKISMTAQTTAEFTQTVIEKKLQKSYRKFAPLNGRKGIIFVDDLNMPQKEKFGAQPPIELLRQWMDYGGWFDLNSDNKDFINIIDVSFLAAMGSVASGRTVSTRYLRHYLVHYADTYSKETLHNIYNRIVQWFFLKTEFPSFSSNVINFKEHLINSTIQMYQEVCNTFKATPAKTHYQFNLRDISRVFLGISRSNALTVQNENDLISLWIHECERIFKDRLVNEQDRDYYKEIVSKVMKISMRRENTFANKDILWGNYVPMIYKNNDPKLGLLDKQYCELKDEELLKNTLNMKLLDYNHDRGRSSESGGPLNLVLFKYAIEHLSRILRIISTYNGNALLVGVGGSGRKSLTMLGTYICKFILRQTEGEWKDCLKNIMKELGKNEFVFLVSDTQVDDAQIEDLNNLLNNGEVPNLIDSTDLQVIKDYIPPEYTGGKKNLTDPEAMTALIENVKAKVHIVLCMSPIGESFRKRILTFPSLVSCTTIDWFLSWPEEALSSVAGFYLKGVKEINDSMLNNIINICVDMQSRVIKYSEKYYQELRRHNYVTPMSFIELLNLFKNLLQQRTIEIKKEIQRYGNGLIVLEESDGIAETMAKEIAILTPQIDEKQKETNKKIEELNVLKEELEIKVVQDKEQNKIATEKKIIAEEQSTKANSRAAEMKVKQDTANEALNEVKAPQVLEIKKYKPDRTMDIFGQFISLLMIKGPKPPKKKKSNPKDPDEPDWFDIFANGKFFKELSGSDLLKKLRNPELSFDKPKAQMEELRDVIASKTDFAPGNKSAAMEAIVKVIKLHNELYFMNEEYLPLKKHAEDLQKELAEAEETLRICRENLEATIRTKEEKEKELQDAFDLIKKLKAKMEQCRKRTTNAGILKDSLGSEREDWMKNKEKLEIFANNIIGDILISSGIIAYLGAFTKAYREEIVYDWAKNIYNSKIPISFSDTQNPNDIMRNIIGDDMIIEEWKAQSLPNDNFSVDNALIMSKSRRYCLLIDPQNQGFLWIKDKIKQEYDAEMKLLQGKKKNEDPSLYLRGGHKRKDGSSTPHYTIKPTMDDKTMLDVTLDAVAMGRSLIYENAGEVLNQVIAPIYKKEFYNDDRRICVSINNQQLEVNENFRFYIITQLPKPHYLPEVCVSLTLVNFTVTEEGLQDQMLNFLVKKEDFASYEKRKDCIEKKNKNEKLKKDTEKLILKQLDESKENATEDNTILDNEKLIESLKNSKKTAQLISDTLRNQKETEAKIAVQRDKLSPVAVHVAQLFFTVCDLGGIEPVYQYSLEFYTEIFRLAIDSLTEDNIEKDDPKRLDILKEKFNAYLYDKICMSLFEKDKLVFSFLMQTKLQMIPYTPEEKRTFYKEVRFLVTGGSGKEFSTPNPAKDDPSEWITNVQWNSICELSQTLEKFKGIEQSFIKDLGKWKEVINISNDPFNETFPAPFDKLDRFFKLIILRILRQDKTVPALKNYISDKIGEKYVLSPQFDIGKAYVESNNKTPIFFIISPGADPLILIEKLCKIQEKPFDTDVKTLSLGQGQEQKALTGIDQAQEKGHWIILQNCHLAKSFMGMLEKKIDEIVDRGSAFRLFLTALPSKVLPLTVVQNSIKIVNEPPRGLKQSIQRTFGTIDEYTYDKCAKVELYRRFAFGFVFFHAMILERRKYGPLGWNIPYEFSNSDLSISVQQLKIFLDDYDDIPYSALNYLVAEANYGGRVTDPQDRRLIKILFADICKEDILEDSYCFNNLKEYPVPKDGSYKEHEAFIETIPVNSAPGIFGLHDNADITCAISDTNTLFTTALLTLPRTVSSQKGASTEDQVKARAEEILSKLPEKYDVDDVRKRHPNKLDESLNSVLHQELMRYNNLLGIVRTCMKNLKDAIDGNAVMTNEIEAMLQSVYDNKTPEKIRKVSYPSMMPFSSWVNDFLKKLAFLQKWIDEGIPTSFWISAFYFTHSFLTGILQNYARKYKIAIDELTFKFEVMSNMNDYDLTKKPEDGCYIYGFFIEGARWNCETKLLDESLPKVLLPALPYVWFKPHKKDENYKEVDFECPVYRTSRRSGELLTTGQSTNFLIHMLLPFDQKLYTCEHWTKRGTAIICSLNE